MENLEKKESLIQANNPVDNKVCDQILNNLNFEILPKKVNSIEDFSKLKEAILLQINEYLRPEYDIENDNFKTAFKNGRYNSFESDDISKHEKILYLFNKKASIYLDILKILLKNGMFESLLSKEERGNLILFIDSKFPHKLNEIVKDIKLDLLKNNYYKDSNFGGLYYGFIKNWKIVSWGEYFSEEEIKNMESKFNEMSDSWLKKYLLWFIELMKNKESSYDKFINLEENEIKSWKEYNKLSFVGPLEHYNLPYLIDLGFEILLADYVKKEEVKDMEDLSKKYFNDWYGISNITLAFTEMLITSGVENLQVVLGRSFPNDKDLSEKYGKIIYIAKARNLLSLEKVANSLKKLWLEPDISRLNMIGLAEVKFHEFWHSLFLDTRPNNTILEELKATLFYYLLLYDKKEFLQEDMLWIENLLMFILGEYIRRIPQKSVKSSYQYWLMDSYILNKAFKNGLIKIEGDSIKIYSDIDAVKKFLEELKNALFEIKRIYEIKDNKERQEEEVKFVGNIFEENALVEDFLKKKSGM